MSIFRPNSENLRIKEFSQNQFGYGHHDKLDFDDNEIHLAIFHLTEMGPSVLYRDFDELEGLDIEPEALTQKINVFAANLIAATGSGHTYSEGCFDVKFDNVDNFRVILIAIKRPNLKYVDPRIKTGYFHIALFIPKNVAYDLPSISKMENHLFNLVKTEITTSSDFKPKKIQKLKKKLIKKLRSYIV